MRHWIIAALGAASLACAGPRRFTAPAPARSLECALTQAQRLGYQRLDGSVDDGAVRVGLRIAPRAADDQVARRDHLREPVTTGPTDTPFDQQLRLRYGRGQLNIEVLSERALRNPEPATQSATDHAQEILARCST